MIDQCTGKKSTKGEKYTFQDFERFSFVPKCIRIDEKLYWIKLNKDFRSIMFCWFLGIESYLFLEVDVKFLFLGRKESC